MIGVVNPDQLRDAVSWQDALSAVRDPLMHLMRGEDAVTVAGLCGIGAEDAAIAAAALRGINIP